MRVRHLLSIVGFITLVIGVLTYFIYPEFYTGKAQSTNAEGPELQQIISGTEPEHKLKAPVYAVVNPAGEVLVADVGNQRIAVFDQKGNFLREFGGATSAKPLNYPYGIGVIKDKYLIADTGAGALYEYDLAGNYRKTWLTPEAKVQPAYVFPAADRQVYVSDLAGNQILVFSEQGKLLREVKPTNVSLGAPQGLAVNQDGTIWVADGANYNVKLLAQEGQALKVFDGGPQWSLTMAKGLAVDAKGRIYVADTLANIIRVFDQDGNNLTGIGAGTEQKSVFQLPVGLSIDAKGKIYIADQRNNQVQVWAWKQ